MSLNVCHRENVTIKARHIAKLSMNLRIDPSVNLFLALEISNKEAIPKITVVMPTTAMYAILLASQIQPCIRKLSQFVKQSLVSLFFQGYYNPLDFPFPYLAGKVMYKPCNSCRPVEY